MNLKGLVCLIVLAPALADAAGPKLEFKSGERIVFIGNTFAERLGKAGYFEAALAARFPEHKLTFRNLGFSGDEVVRGTLATGAGPRTIGKFEENTLLQLRGLNFGDLHTHLHQQKPDIIFACYGMMESFAGQPGLAKFSADLESFLRMNLGMNYSGRGNPRIVLVSPIAHEKLGGDAPDPASHNQDLKAYSEAMGKVAAALNLPFINLFTPTLTLMNETMVSRLTINGIHLNEYGHWATAQLMLEQLGLASQQKLELDAAGGMVDAVGLKASPVDRKAEKIAFTVTPELLPGASPPANIQFAAGPFVVIKGLAPGEYELRIDGSVAATADAAAWKEGQRLKSALGSERAARLRELVDEKNWHFFMRYRPVNGEYIYGRRKAPFGVKSFPPEWELLDKMVAEQDAKIWESARPAATQQVELVRAKK